MRILFYMPFEVLSRCFHGSDLEHLSSSHHVIMPDPSADDNELRLFGMHHASMCDVIVTGWNTPPLSDSLLASAVDLKAVIHSAGSVKHLLPESFWRREIVLASCRDALAVGVAETTLGLIIIGLKRVLEADRLTRAGGWKSDIWATDLQIRELFGLQIGVVGASSVGRHLMRLLRSFEVSVAVYDPYVTDGDMLALGAQRIGLDELIRTSDVVSLHAPSLDETRHMIDETMLRAMKDGALLINTARGALIDEAALISELRRGRINAIIDVTDPEPPCCDHSLRKLPNCVITPHIAGSVSNGCYRLGRSVVDQLLAYCAGNEMVGRIQPGMLSRLG